MKTIQAINTSEAGLIDIVWRLENGKLQTERLSFEQLGGMTSLQFLLYLKAKIQESFDDLSDYKWRERVVAYERLKARSEINKDTWAKLMSESIADLNNLDSGDIAAITADTSDKQDEKTPQANLEDWWKWGDYAE